MKNSIKYLLLSAAALAAVSCESWLDVTPPSEIRAEAHYSSAEGFQQTLIGCYLAMGETDLYGENLMLMHRGWSHYVDQLRDDLWQHHPQIHIVDFDFYSMDVFNRCENTNDVLLAIPGWANVHPLLKVIPVEWEHNIPYGILHSPEPTPTVRRFLDAAKAVRKELYG